MFKKIVHGSIFTVIGFSLICGYAWAQEFTLKSSSIKGSTITQPFTLSSDYGFGCDGDNRSPQLSWENPPENTKSYILTVYDPDAPTGIGWTHWVVVNIPASTTHIAENVGQSPDQLPNGALQTRTDFGVPGYGGACPPEGRKHRYVFTLTALSVEKLELDKNAMPALVGFLKHANSLGSASLTFTYER